MKLRVAYRTGMYEVQSSFWPIHTESKKINKKVLTNPFTKKIVYITERALFSSILFEEVFFLRWTVFFESVHWNDRSKEPILGTESNSPSLFPFAHPSSVELPSLFRTPERQREQTPRGEGINLLLSSSYPRDWTRIFSLCVQPCWKEKD